VTATPDAATEDTELEAFRTTVRAWLDANAERRSTDSNDFKARMAVSTPQSHDEELAHVAACKAWQRRLFDAGYAGIAVAAEYGGQGGTQAQQRVFSQESARYEIDTGVFSVGIGMVIPTLLAYGTEEQKQRFIPAMLRGDEVWCQLFSEPGAGSDLAGLTTRAERVGSPDGRDEWVVNGQKVWNSFAHVADWGVLLARTDWDVPKHRGISYFLVDMTTPGIEVRPLRQATGVAHFNETFLSDVRIPVENLCGEVDGGWGVAQATLMAERTLIGGGTGLGFRDYVALAQHFGRTADPEVRQRLAESYTRSEILRWLGMRAQAAAASGRMTGMEGSIAKLAISEHVARNGDLGLAIEGPAAMLAGGDAFEGGFWQQHFLGQWGIRIGGGTEQVQRNILGERGLGLPAEPRPDKSAPFRDVPKN